MKEKFEFRPLKASTAVFEVYHDGKYIGMVVGSGYRWAATWNSSTPDVSSFHYSSRDLAAESLLRRMRK